VVSARSGRMVDVWTERDYGELEALGSDWARPSLAGRLAMVTGAAAGIGKAVALRLANAGARLVLCDLDQEGGQATAAEAGKAVFVRADVADSDELRTVFDHAAGLGPLDIVVNNAGGTQSPHFPDAAPEHWGRTLSVNLGGTALGTYLAVQTMKGRGGAVVNVSSVAGFGWTTYESPEYAAAKAAVNRLTSTLGGLADQGIRVNAICPDWVAIETLVDERARTPHDEWEGPPELVPLEPIADAIFRLACDKSLAGRILVCPAGEQQWGLIPIRAPR
jgi:NAD(P)-dependent dehydrogenase (short-subunit alcohol dehydrogenase family)